MAWWYKLVVSNVVIKNNLHNLFESLFYLLSNACIASYYYGEKILYNKFL